MYRDEESGLGRVNTNREAHRRLERSSGRPGT
jgi:hypothetical protein